MAPHTGKNALIIGGTHGIGLATAKALLSQGVKVVIAGRRIEPVEAAKKELASITSKDSNGDALAIQSDITSLSAHANLQKTVETHFGSGPVLDLLFINAGYSSFEPFTASSEENFDKHFDTNTRGPFFIAQRFTPTIRPGGSIIFTTSVSIGSGYPGMALYSASKAAVYSFVQTLAAELAHGADGKDGIRVNSISPGFVDTPTMGVVGASKQDREAFAEIGRKTTPMGRIAGVEEVARAVVFLAFDATFTTGTEFLMDGGSRYLAPHLE